MISSLRCTHHPDPSSMSELLPRWQNSVPGSKAGASALLFVGQTSSRGLPRGPRGRGSENQLRHKQLSTPGTAKLARGWCGKAGPTGEGSQHQRLGEWRGGGRRGEAGIYSNKKDLQKNGVDPAPSFMRVQKEAGWRGSLAPFCLRWSRAQRP